MLKRLSMCLPPVRPRTDTRLVDSDWTEHRSSDPGITLLQLFAYLARDCWHGSADDRSDGLLHRPRRADDKGVVSNYLAIA